MTLVSLKRTKRTKEKDKTEKKTAKEKRKGKNKRKMKNTQCLFCREVNRRSDSVSLI
jgi:hypothetical protein